MNLDVSERNDYNKKIEQGNVVYCRSRVGMGRAICVDKAAMQACLQRLHPDKADRH